MNVTELARLLLEDPQWLVVLGFLKAACVLNTPLRMVFCDSLAQDGRVIMRDRLPVGTKSCCVAAP